MDSINRRQFVAGALVAALTSSALDSDPVRSPRVESDDPIPTPAPVTQYEEPPLPASVYARLGSARFRTREGSGYPHLTPDGRHLVKDTWNKIRVVNAITGRLIAEYELHDGIRYIGVPRIQALANSSFLTFKRDGDVWKLHTVEVLSGLILKTIQLGKKLEQFGFGIDPLGRRLILVAGNQYRCLDCESGAILWTNDTISTRGNDYGNFYEFSGDGSRVAILAGEKVTFLDAAKGFQLREDNPAQRTRLSQTGAAVVEYNSNPPRLLARDVVTAQRFWEKKFDEDETIHAMEFLPDDSTFFVGLDSGSLLLDAKTGDVIRRFPDCSAHGISISNDAKLAVCTNGDGGLEFFDLNTGTRLSQSMDPPGEIHRLHFLSSRQIVGQARGFSTIWDIASGSARTIRANESAEDYYERIPSIGDSRHAGNIAIAPDGLSHAIVGSTGVRIDPAKPWVWRDFKQRGIRKIAFANRTTLIGLAIFDDRNLRLRHGREGAFVVFDSGTNFSVSFPANSPVDIYLTGDRRSAYFISMYPGTRLGAHYSPDQYFLSRYDLSTRKVTDLTPKSSLNNLSDFSATLDGKIFAATETFPGESTSIVFRNGRTGEILHKLPSVGRIWLCTISPDGRMIALYREIPLPDSEINDVFGPRERSIQELQLVELGTWSIRRRFPPMSLPEALAFSPDGRTLATAHTEAPVYLWDIHGERTNPLPKPDADALRTAWNDLASLDAEVGFRAICLLVQHPSEALPMLAANLKPAAVPDTKRVSKTIEDLANRDYRTREAAERELHGIVDEVRPQLQAAYDAGTHGPEADLRLEQLLQRTSSGTPQTIRTIRAHEILERIGTPAAKSIIEANAKCAPEAVQTKDAVATLGRWAIGS